MVNRIPQALQLAIIHPAIKASKGQKMRFICLW